MAVYLYSTDPEGFYSVVNDSFVLSLPLETEDVPPIWNSFDIESLDTELCEKTDDILMTVEENSIFVIKDSDIQECLKGEGEVEKTRGPTVYRVSLKANATVSEEDVGVHQLVLVLDGCASPTLQSEPLVVKGNSALNGHGLVV